MNENLLDERIETWVLYCGSACEAIERFSTLELALKEVQQSMERREERLNVLKKTLSSKTGTSSAEDQKLIDLTEAFEKVSISFFPFSIHIFYILFD